MAKCEATIVFGDDFGDSTTTFHCQLEAGHKGSHKETGDAGYGLIKMPYTLTWQIAGEEFVTARHAQVAVA